MSSEQIPFTISTQGTVAPGGPHGVPPSDVNAAIVAEQDKSLTTKVGEKVEALKESAQPYVQPVVAAAQPYVQAASNTAVNVAVAGKEAVVSGATQLGIVTDNSGPHGVPPTDANHQGVVANQDKSISTRVSEAAQPYVQPVIDAAQPIVQAAQGAVVATKEAVVSGVHAIGIGANTNQNQSQTPGGPHGVPPSESGPGVVATEDKKYTTRVSEAAQPYIQPVVDAAQPYVSAAAGVVGSATQSAANTITNVTHSVTGDSKSTTGTIPEGPHGLAPSESGPGVVAQEDKSLTTRVIEAAQPVIQPVVNAAQGAAAVVGQVAAQARDVVTTQSSQIGEQIAELRDEAQRQAGFGVATSGGRPEPPHGVAPSTGNHQGLVSNQDKTYVQIAGEKLADAKDQAAATLTNVVGEVKHQVGLGVNVQAGTVPEGPHGVAPSSGNHQGLVSNQDKTYVQIAGEKVAEAKDQAAASLSNVVGEAKHQAGLGVNVPAGRIPEGPHGVAPSEGLHQGLVSNQDKTIAQIAGEKVADAKDQAAAALNNAANNVQGVVGEVKHQAGLGVNIPAGSKPEPPHGIAPSEGLHQGLVSEQDKVISQKAGEKIEQVRDQAVNTVNSASAQIQSAASNAKDQATAAVNQAAGAVNNAVGEAKFQAGAGVNVQAGVTPVAPHGVAPSEGLHQGLVAQQDKTVAQVAGEKLGL